MNQAEKLELKKKAGKLQQEIKEISGDTVYLDAFYSFLVLKHDEIAKQTLIGMQSYLDVLKEQQKEKKWITPSQ